MRQARFGVLNIIGCGRAAGSLARLWQQQGLFTVGNVLNRSTESAHAAVGRLAAGEAVAQLTDLGEAPAWLLGLPDSRLANMAEQLAGSGRDWQGKLVFHLSGLASSEVLEPLAARGARIASAHPVRSFPRWLDSPDLMRGVPCVIEGQPAACAPLVAAFTELGAEVSQPERLLKARYHAATVVASNYTTSLAWLAQQLLLTSGMTEQGAVAISRSLMQGAIENVSAEGAAAALTGPIERGDLGALEAHLDGLGGLPPRWQLAYRELARLTLDLADLKRPLDAEFRQAALALLDREPAARWSADSDTSDTDQRAD